MTRLGRDACANLFEMTAWYHNGNGQPVGPLDDEAMRSLIRDARLSPATMVWREGMTAWQQLGQVPELAPPQTVVTYQTASVLTSNYATASLVTGILAWLVCPLLGSVPAVICGHLALSEIAKSPTAISGRGLATAGLILGYIQIFLCALIAMGFLVLIAITVLSQPQSF